MKESKCFNCGKDLTTRSQLRYCSNKCQVGYQHKNYIEDWKIGKNITATNTKNIPKYIKNYLLEKFENKCTKCGWNKKHPNTGKVPLEVDHIDGNSGNNKETNVRLLCPNCHALTPTFKNLNRGKGRKWRTRNT